MQTLIAPLSVNVIFQFTVQNQNCTVEYNNKIIQSDVSINRVSLVVLKLGHASKTNLFFSFSVKLNIIAPFNKKNYSKCSA